LALHYLRDVRWHKREGMNSAMSRNNRLLFGPLAAAIFGFGVAGLAMMIPSYSHVRQTVSEIGEMDSRARIPFAIMLCCVAICLLIFASGVRDVSVKAGHGRVAAYLIAAMAVAAAGVGIFAFPHPFHNIFGESELIGYQAPMALALEWRNDPKARKLVASSWILFALTWVSIALNLSALDRHGFVWAFIGPFYGLIQRSLFVTWFGWGSVAGLLLWHGNESFKESTKLPTKRRVRSSTV
jgi:hypothetical membrane protein